MRTNRKLSPAEFLSCASQDPISPNILLLGEESYFQDLILKTLRKTLLGEDNPEFSTFAFDLTQTSLEESVDAAATHSLLSPHKLVVVRELDRLRENQIKERDEAVLEHYLADPNPQTTFLILAEKLDGRRRITQLIQKHAWTVDCSRLGNGEVLQWVNDRIRAAQKTIDPYAARELVEAVGNSLTLLEQEVEKILSFIGRRDRVTREDVEVLMFRARVNSVFDLVDAINRKDRDASLTILSNLFENDIEATQILFWLARLYRQLLTVKEQKRRLDVWGVTRLLRVPREFAERLLQQERKFTREELLGGFHKFAAFDQAIKSSSVDSKLRCEFFVFELISGGSRLSSQ